MTGATLPLLIPIPDLPAATLPLSDGDYLAVAQGDTAKRVSPADLFRISTSFTIEATGTLALLGGTAVDITSGGTLAMEADGAITITSTAGQVILTARGRLSLISQLVNVSIGAGQVPAIASSQGNPGDVAWNSTHFFVCVDFDVWKRVALSTW